MKLSKLFVLGCFFSVSLVSHADLLVTRSPGAAEVLVRDCVQADVPASCRESFAMTVRQLKRVRKTISWRSYGRLLAFSLTTQPMFIPMPNFMHEEYVSLRVLAIQLQGLIKGTTDSVVLKYDGPGGHEVHQIFERAIRRARPVPVS